MIVAGALIVLGGIWVAVTGLLVRSQLESVKNEVHLLRVQVSQGQLDQARGTLAGLRKHAHRARVLSEGPAWAIAAALPGGGEPIRTVRGIAANVDDLAQVTLPALLDARAGLDPSTLRKPDGSIDLAPITALAPTLARADAALTHATTSIKDLPDDTWVSPVDSARTEILSELDGVAGTVRSADLGAQILPAMLGDGGVRRYFVGFQNEAEARGTGGLPGAFGILEADHGKVHFTRFENDSTLGRVPTGLDFGAAYDELYGGYDTTSLYVNSNISPHFPYAAQTWAAMWQRFSGQQLDGAIAVDPTTLGYLLNVTGAVTLKDGTRVDGGNVVSLTQNTIYSKVPNVAKRKAYLLQIAKTVSTHVVESHASASSMVDAVGRAIGERRVLVWSAHPATEAKLMQTAASGAVPRTKHPYVGLSVINEGANKLDYYLDRALTWQRTGCGATRQVTVTVALTNTAPASGLPAYVTNRSDDHESKVRPGDNRDYVNYAATAGALLDSATIDGRPVSVAAGQERGHPVYSVDVELPRGTTTTVVFHLSEPAGSGAPIVLQQPLVRPLTVTLDDAKCG